MRQEAKRRTVELIGEDAMRTLENSKVIVFGIGGVGGYTVEALARSAVGLIALVDGDVISESNINRQIIADTETIGRSKVEVMQERINKINPQCKVEIYEQYYGVDEFFIDFSQYDYVVDAVDMVSAKLKIIEESQRAGVSVISSMGTGNKVSAEHFTICDIKDTAVCPLARVMRRELRNRGIEGVKVVYSPEKPVKTTADHPASIAFVPPVAGLLMAGEIVRDLIGE